LGCTPKALPESGFSSASPVLAADVLLVTFYPSYWPGGALDGDFPAAAADECSLAWMWWHPADRTLLWILSNFVGFGFGTVPYASAIVWYGKPATAPSSF
jgi:hypothetical protein